MKKGKEKKYSLKGSSLWGLLVFGLLFFVDMITKVVADVYFTKYPTPIKLIPECLELQISYNEGMAFSMGSDWSTEAKIALVCGTGLIFVGLLVLYFMLDKRRSWLRNSLIFVVAGGVGNFVDRILYLLGQLGGVRDMVRLKIFIFDFGVCNFADFFIVGGGIALMLALLFFDGSAVWPTGKKYKALAEEFEEREEMKKQAKAK